MRSYRACLGVSTLDEPGHTQLTSFFFFIYPLIVPDHFLSKEKNQPCIFSQSNILLSTVVLIVCAILRGLSSLKELDAILMHCYTCIHVFIVPSLPSLSFIHSLIHSFTMSVFYLQSTKECIIRDK